jgi:hypothetical protein
MATCSGEGRATTLWRGRPTIRRHPSAAVDASPTAACVASRDADGGVRRRAVCRVRACYAYNMAYNENDDLSTLERELRARDGPRARYAARRH